MIDIYFDGGSVPNPGKMSCCVVIGKKIYQEIAFADGTNNLAEWTAHLWACEIAIKNHHKDVTFYGDSNLVIMQALGKWKVKNKDFIPFKQNFDEMKKEFTSVKLIHVKRDFNLAGHVLENK